MYLSGICVLSISRLYIPETLRDRAFPRCHGKGLGVRSADREGGKGNTVLGLHVSAARLLLGSVPRILVCEFQSSYSAYTPDISNGKDDTVRYREYLRVVARNVSQGQALSLRGADCTSQTKLI